jgi:hypothetical protein
MTDDGDNSTFLTHCLFSYISSSGINVGDCFSEHSPCRTFSFAIDVVIDLDIITIVILECNFTSASLEINNNTVCIFEANMIDLIPVNVNISFDSSSEIGEAMFKVKSSILDFSNLRFIHNSNSKGAFIFLGDGYGSVSLLSCCIYGYDSNISLSSALYSFFQVSFDENYFGSVFFENVNCFNISFSTKSIIESSGNSSITILNCSFNCINGSGKGCGMNIVSSFSFNIILCEFENVSSDGDGGCIYFGENSLSLVINSSSFSSCSSRTGYGGAVAYENNNGIYICLFSDEFNDNNCGEGKKGNDYCDISSSNSSLSLYSCSSLSFIRSSSTYDRFYHTSSNLSLDFLVEHCGNITLFFVDCNSTTAANSEICGGFFLPCLSFDYVLFNFVSNPMGILLNSGNYNISYYSFFSRVVSVTGLTKSYNGNVDLNESNTYPVIISNSSEILNSGIVFLLNSSTKMTVENIKLFFSSSHPNFFFFQSFFFFLIFYFIFCLKLKVDYSSSIILRNCICSAVGDNISRSVFLYALSCNISITNCIILI